MKIENLKAEYMDDKLTYEFLHNGKVVEGCIPKVHYRASFYDVQQVEETYDTNTTTSYTFTKGTNIEGLHIQVFLMDIVDGKTCVVESLIKLTVKNDWDGDLATTSLIPHIKTQTYVSLETNPNKEVAMQKDYKDENFQEEPIGPDTDPNGNLASLEAKINELTELVLNQHRVITHMSDMMSIVHFDLLRLISHYRPTTPYCPSHQPPTTPGFYPPHQPPFTPGSYPQQPKPSFNPQQQQPVMGNCAGMGQGLCRNPVPQQSSPTAGQMPDHLTYWANFANRNYSMANMVNMGSDSVKFTNSETPTHHTTSNSVLDQMNGLNQRVKAQQQPTATKEEIKDQPNFRSNFLK